MRILLLVVAAACGFPVGNAAADSRATSASEWQVKSAFIYNFTKFVEWPQTALSSPSQPVVIGVLGEPMLAQQLATVVAGRNVNGRQVEVRVVQTAAQARVTQVLFVAAEEDTRYAAMREELADNAVLTIGESPSFSVMGVIGFVSDGEKLRFEINADMAERSRLKVSAQLQKLAIAVRRTP